MQAMASNVGQMTRRREPPALPREADLLVKDAEGQKGRKRGGEHHVIWSIQVVPAAISTTLGAAASALAALGLGATGRSDCEGLLPSCTRAPNAQSRHRARSPSTHSVYRLRKNRDFVCKMSAPALPRSTLSLASGRLPSLTQLPAETRCGSCGDATAPQPPKAQPAGWRKGWSGTLHAMRYKTPMQPRSTAGWVSAFVAVSVATPLLFGQQPVGLNAREHRVPAGTTALYARDIGKGRPAIVLHGGPDFDTAYLLPSLDAFGDIYRLVYFDQRGRGQSADGVRPDDVSLATDLEDVERVRQHFGLDAPTLLGHSWGTVLALEYALRYPNRVSQLVLMNPAPASSADAALLRKAYTSQLGDQMERQRAIVTGQPYQQGDPDTVAARYRIHFTHALAKPEHYEALMRTMRAAFVAQGAAGILKARAVEDRLMADTWEQASYDLMPRLASLRVPTLVLWGDRDFIPREISEHLVDALPEARLVTLDGCGHFAYLECPAAVRTALLDFAR